MSNLVAPPELFSAHALASFHPGDFGFDGKPDPMLAKGTHLRIFAGTSQSFPITPFAVCRTMSFDLEALALTATNAEIRGRTVVLDDREASIGLILSTLDTGVVVRIDARPDGEIRRAALYDPSGRLVQERTSGGWQFAAPVLQRLRMDGRGPVEISARAVDIGNLFEREQELMPDDVIGLPLPDGRGLHRWYLALDDESTALDRVQRGSPSLLTPMDRPDGPFDLPPGAEVERVIRLLDADGDFRVRLWKMLDGDRPPWMQEHNRLTGMSAGSAAQTVHLPAAGMLQMASLDPGLARYFGFAGHYELSPDLTAARGGRGWDTFAVLGLFALDPQLVERLALQIDQPDAAGPNRVISLMLRIFQRHAPERNVAADLSGLIRQVQSEGLVVAPFVTFAAPVLPPLAPTLPDAEVVSHVWQTAEDPAEPSSLYRAGFAFPDPPLVALAAVRREGAGGIEARHRLFDTDLVPQRAVPRMLGYEREANSRHRLLGRRIRDQRPAARLADENIPAIDGVADYRFAASDIFGRFGPWSGALPLGPPPRPVPPPPVLSGHVERRTEGLDADGPLSMGTLRIAVAVPSADAQAFTDEERLEHGRMIVVPRLDELPAGAMPLAVLRLQFGDEARDVPLDQPGIQETEFALPDLVPPQPRDSAILMGHFIDSEGREGPPASRTFDYVELRPPPAHETGVGLYWTSPPGPSLEVELDLVWRGRDGASYRVYLTDAVGLGLDVPAARMSRGEIAVLGCRRVRDGGAVPRDRFRLLTPKPIATGPDLLVRFSHRLPRTLATVQFLRVVPVGPDGAEPAFDRCGVVPVAVPEGRRPVAARLDGKFDLETGTPHLTVVADGFNPDILAREEPGLFTPGLAGAAPPRFRIRRAVAAVADPAYARVVGEGDMALAPEKDRFTAKWSGAPLEPFVRYGFWAEVQLPPERRGPAGLDLVAPANGIAPPDAQRREAFPRPFSRCSAVRMLVYVPTDPPLALDPAKVTIRRQPEVGGKLPLDIAIADAPRAHPSASDRYRLAVWGQWRDRWIEDATDPAQPWPDMESGLVTVEIAIPDGMEATSALTLRLAVVDPAGRVGPILKIDVPEAEPPGRIVARRPTNPKRKARP